MSITYNLRVLGPVDGHEIARRMQPLEMPVVVNPPMATFVELLESPGKFWERDGVDTRIAVPVDKFKSLRAQRELVLDAVDRVLRSGGEDLVLAFEDRLLLRRINGVIERFEHPA